MLISVSIRDIMKPGPPVCNLPTSITEERNLSPIHQAIIQISKQVVYPVLSHLRCHPSSHRSAEPVAILAIQDLHTRHPCIARLDQDAIPSPSKSYSSPLGGHSKHGQAIRRPLHRHHGRLAVLPVQATLVVIIKEGVESCAIQEHVGRIHHPQPPGHVRRVYSPPPPKAGSLPAGVNGAGAAGVGLEVRGLGLDDGHVDVARVAELVLVEDRVLGGGSVQPRGVLRLEKHAAAAVDVDLAMVRRVEVVICHPEPGVLKENRRLGGGVEEGGARRRTLDSASSARWVS